MTEAQTRAMKKWIAKNRDLYLVVNAQAANKYYYTHKEQSAEKSRKRYVFKKEWERLRNINIF